MVGIIIAIIATLVIAVPVSAYVANTRSKKAMEITIGNAEDKAREIIDEAIKAADAKKREASLEVKEETIKARQKNAGQNCRSMSREFFLRKRLSRRKQPCWNAKNSH